MFRGGRGQGHWDTHAKACVTFWGEAFGDSKAVRHAEPEKLRDGQPVVIPAIGSFPAPLVGCIACQETASTARLVGLRLFHFSVVSAVGSMRRAAARAFWAVIHRIARARCPCC